MDTRHDAGADSVVAEPDRPSPSAHDELDHEALLARFQPIIRYTEGEYFLPMSIDDYLPHCRLWLHSGRRARRIVADVGALDRDRLVEITAGRAGTWSLQYVHDPLPRRSLIAWRIDSDRPRFTSGSRLGSVGVLSRLIDSLMRFTLLLRGRVVAGTEASAELAYRPLRNQTEHHCYGRVVRQAGYVVLQYWFFYAFNDWRSRAYGVNDHEADWEQVTIYCAEHDDTVTPQWVVFSAHDEQGDDLRRRWDDPDLSLAGDHPIVFAGLGSHSGAYRPGDYLLTVDRAALGHLYRIGRRIARTVLPWTRQSDAVGLGAPYIDYARGDGEVVGDGPRRWTCELIDDATPWVAGYRGMWGNDTEDPFGGERGPAGPRYERDGSIRLSWRDPVGWAGLAKVAPDAGELAASIERRTIDLDRDLALERDRHEQLVDQLRTATAVGRPVAELEQAAAEQSARLANLVEERRQLDAAAQRPATVAGPHDHLRHRRMPMEPIDSVRHRVLAVWSAISTPLVLVTLALLVLPLGTSVAGLAVASLLVVFALEALSRRRLVSFVLTVVVVATGAVVLGAIVVGLIQGWRFTVAALLVLAAVVVVVLNLAELRRR